MGPIHAEVLLSIGGKDITLRGTGNGPISAFAEALRSQLNFKFTLERFEELSVTKGADSDALAYISISRQGEERWVHGVGLAANIDQAGFKAILSCVNQLSL